MRLASEVGAVFSGTMPSLGESDTNSVVSVRTKLQTVSVGVETKQYYFYLKFSFILRQSVDPE